MGSELVYDCRNRLISAGGVTYTYDAENNRISAETDKYVQEYVTDTVSASLSRVLTMTVYEKTAGKAETAGTTTTYLYGQGLISEQTGDLYLYHHYNHLGSTMLLTDAEGQIIERYTYGVYGELLSGDVSLTRFLYNGRCGVSTDDNGLYYMRQRYYNPEIKRFVNQDILAGSLGNSQSLNRYSYVQGNPVSYTDPFGLSPSGGLFSNTNFAHSFFGLLSCVTGIVGACASLADGLVYALVDKDYAMAGLCALDVVSMGLGKFATNLIRGQKMTNTGVALYRSAKLMSNVSSFGQNAIALNQNVGTILEKWDSGVSASGTDFLALGMSVFGCAISGGGILHDVGQIRQMRSDADFMKGLKSELGQFGNGIKTSFAEFAGNNARFFDLGYFKSGSGSLNEGTFSRYLVDGRQVTDVTNLPGSTGIQMSRRLTTDEMAFLTQEYGVEFAQVYHRGAGKNGGGGYYMLYSGNHNSVSISQSIGPDAILINHTHPRGTMQPSPQDISLLQYLQSIGSPQKVSEIIPIGKGTTVFFNVNGVKR